MDLSTYYLGLKLKHPLVCGASPLSRDLDGIRRLEDAGASAIVLFSLFEEQLTAEENYIDHYLTYGGDSSPEVQSYFPEADKYLVGPDGYLELIRSAREAVQVPIIASLNGVSTGGWVDFARRIEEAGANALELNVYFIPTQDSISGAEVEHVTIDVVKDVRAAVKIPVAVKLSPYFSAPANLCRRLADAGANGLVLFNRFYQPDFNLEDLSVVPNLRLSSPNELLLPLRWIAVLYGRVQADLAVSTGVHSAEDVIKAMMAGARATLLVSALLKNGIARIGTLQSEIAEWMAKHDYYSIRQMQGSMSLGHVAEPAAFTRANYMKMLQSVTPDPTGRMV